MDHPESNYGNLYRELLRRIEIPHDNVKYIKHLESMECSRIEYQFELEEFFRERGKGFDLVILGMGKDGHTASLFPDNVDIEEMVVPSLKSDNHEYSRISLGMDTINDCSKKMFLLTKEKKEILKKIPEGKYPASRVTGDVLYLLEE